MLKFKHLKIEQHQTQNKCNRNESTALVRPVTITGAGGGGGGGGGGGALNRFYGALHSHLPPRFTQFSWLFGSHGGLLAHQCVIMGNN